MMVRIKIWWHMLHKGRRHYEHYYKKDWRSGDGYHSYGAGIEIINSKTGKVVYRKGRETSSLDCSYCPWNDFSIWFSKNIN